MVLACGLALWGPVAAASPAVPPCSDCTGTRTVDSTRSLTVLRARSAARAGEWNHAAELWRDALLIDDHSAKDWIAMGDVLLAAERHREAVAAYQRAIQLDKRISLVGTRSVARAYARMGNDRQAVRWLEQALRLGARSDEVLMEPVFERYRTEVRLQGAARQIERREEGSRRSAEASRS
jgi:tetratricopeptide (TPR) repeat protein